MQGTFIKDRSPHTHFSSNVNVRTMFSVSRCSVDPVCAHPWGGAQCSGCAVGYTMVGAACRPETVIRKDVARLEPGDRTVLLNVVAESAELGTRLNQVTQAAHQAAVADKVYAPFNVAPGTGRALRNIHASFFFFNWHGKQTFNLHAPLTLPVGHSLAIGSDPARRAQPGDRLSPGSARRAGSKEHTN